MDEALRQLLKKLDDLYEKKVQQIAAASRVGNMGEIGEAFAVYAHERQRILDEYGKTKGKEN